MVTPLPVTLGEFKDELNIGTTTTAQDAELERKLEAATRAIEKRIGALEIREVSERLTARGGRIVVTLRPLVSVSSAVAVVSGTSYAVADLDADPYGFISWLNGCLPDGRYNVTYEAGRADVSDDHREAVLVTAVQLWESQRGKARHANWGAARADSSGGGMGDASAKYVYGGFALPKRALELIRGDEEIFVA